jgi:hypothetical protein
MYYDTLTKEDKNYVIFSDAEKAFDKIQHSMVKNIYRLGIEGMHLNTIGSICDKPIASIILSREKLKAFLLKSRISTSFSSTGSPKKTKERKRSKSHPIRTRQSEIVSI